MYRIRHTCDSARAVDPAPLLNPYLDLRRALEAQPEPLQLELRKKLIWAYSWAVPTNEIIRRIAEFSPIVELGAGTGYWAWLIAQAGGKIRPFDQNPAQPPRWVEIQYANPSDLTSATERTLLLCWPPLDETMAEQALRAFRGEHVIYVGEWRGRTADPAFHDRLEREWLREEIIPLPSWPGYRDEVYLYTRRGSINS